MDLLLSSSNKQSCERSKDIGKDLPSLDDYNISSVTVTYLPSPRSYMNSDNKEDIQR